eukprot:g20067.t1
MLPPSGGAPRTTSGSGNSRRSSPHRRRPTTATATPRAPQASAAASALAACLAALILNTTGDSPPALATAFLTGGTCCYPPTCFLHAAATAATTGSSCRTRAGLGSSHGVNSLPGFAAGAAGAARAGATATTGLNGKFSSARRRRRSQLALACGAGGSEGGVIAGPRLLRLGGTREEVAAAHAGGFGCEDPRRSRGRGRGRLDMTGAQGQDGGGGGGGDANGIRAARKLEAATTTSSGGGAREEAVDAASDGGGLRDLTKMKLSELKELYREGGGKPGNLRKAELVERLSDRQLPPADATAVPSSPSKAGAAAVTTPSLVVTAEKAAAAGEQAVGSEGVLPVAPLPLLEAEGESPAAQGLFGGLNGDSGAAVVRDEMAGPAMRHHQAPQPRGEEDFITDASSITYPPPPAAAGGDLLSSGPSAVVAAARARGAAAAAASSKMAAGGRFKAMTEARRHTEAVRARAASRNSHNAWAQQPAETGQRRQHQHQPHQTEDTGASATVTATATLDGSGNGSAVRDGAMGTRGLGGLHHGAQAAPGAAAMAAVAAAEAARAAVAAEAAGAATASNSHEGHSGASGQPDRRRNAAPGPGLGARGRGRHRQVVEGGAWSVLVDPPVSRRSSSQPWRRRMPIAFNPWARRGRAGGQDDGMPEEGDVVDAFLADTMMRQSDDREASGDPLFDRESRFEVCGAGAPLQLTFLGTASCIPSTSRGVSCTVLRNEGELWVFDVGEATQIQIQRSSLKPTRITKIFITHSHGDHSFGLPGLLCLMGTNYDRNDNRRVEIYGPTGLRAYLRAAIMYTSSKAVVPYVVHELMDVRYLHGDFATPPEPFHVDIGGDSRYGEREGGRNFYPDKNGHYELFQDEKVTVRAAPMKHGVPCVGFSIEEADRPGRLLAEKLTPILKEHKKAITKTTGRGDIGWVLGWIKSMKRGEMITLPGTDVTINSADYVGESVKGRKVVILGDTCDAGSMVPLAMGADVVVHEATNTFLPPLDQAKTYADVETEAINHGHSTPAMAAAFAQKVEAKTLILNHFSARYKGDPSDASVAAMMRIERQAAKAGGFERHQVVASWDLLELPVLSADQWEADRDKKREADAAFDAELLKRAQQWQAGETAGEASSSSEAAAAEEAATPRRTYEHEHSRDFLEGAEVAPAAVVAAAAGAEAAPDGTRRLEQGGDAGSGASNEQGDGATGANGSTTAVNTGLVGIMYDAKV